MAEESPSVQFKVDLIHIQKQLNCNHRSQPTLNTHKNKITSHRWNHFVTAFFLSLFNWMRAHTKNRKYFRDKYFRVRFFPLDFWFRFHWLKKKKTNYVERHCKECLSQNPMTRFGLHSKISIHRWLYLDNYLCGEPKNLG